MRERLDAGDDLDAEGVGVIVELTHVGFGVFGAHMAEIRLAGHLVAVLAVEHQHRKPHHRHRAQQGLHAADVDDRVALRNVEHRAVHREIDVLGDRKVALTGAQALDEQPERAEKVDAAVVAKRHGVPGLRDGQAVGRAAFDRDGQRAGADFKARLDAELRGKFADTRAEEGDVAGKVQLHGQQLSFSFIG